jgi:hypothetical protein
MRLHGWPSSNLQSCPVPPFSSVNRTSPTPSRKTPLRVENSSIPLSVMTSCRAASVCHPSCGSGFVSWIDTEVIGNLPLNKSPRGPGSRSMIPSAKWEFPSPPVHSRTHRIMYMFLVLKHCVDLGFGKFTLLMG